MDPDAEVVELGAGVGSLAERLLDRLPDGRVVALELDPVLRRIGEVRTSELLPPGGVLVNFDFAAVPGDDEDDEVAAAVSALAARRSQHGAWNVVRRPRSGSTARTGRRPRARAARR